MMTCSSVAFKATLKAIYSIKCHIHNLFQFYAETVLVLNDFPDYYLMHVGRNDFHFSRILQVGKIRNRKINLFHFGPKPSENLKTSEGMTKSAGLLQVT